LKILLAHNFYGSSAPSGENSVFLAEMELLKQHGNTIVEFTRHSDEIRDRGFVGEIQGALATTWNPFSKRALWKLLEREQPDIMHVHNTFPLLSPSIFHATRDSKTAVVLTLHNYRIFCAAGIPMRDGTPCTECLDSRSVSPGVRYGCYRNSKIATVPMASMVALHRRVGTWSKHVDAFISLTEFQKEKMADAGLLKEKMYVKPPFYVDPPVPLPWREREQKVVFIGRLGIEKGVDNLIEAWKLWGRGAPRLEIIGDGPEKDGLLKSIRGNGVEDKICFTGQLDSSSVRKRLGEARLLVLPSICFEGFPIVIPEAFSLGVPAAVSRLGPLPSIVTEGKNGETFLPRDPVDLHRVLIKMWNSQEKLAEMGKAARKEFDGKYTTDVNYGILMKIYRSAMEKRKSNIG